MVSGMQRALADLLWFCMQLRLPHSLKAWTTTKARESEAITRLAPLQPLPSTCRTSMHSVRVYLQLLFPCLTWCWDDVTRQQHLSNVPPFVLLLGDSCFVSMQSQASAWASPCHQCRVWEVRQCGRMATQTMRMTTLTMARRRRGRACQHVIPWIC